MHSRISAQVKQRRSGYEPSDTEAEWQDSPWNDADKKDEESNDAGPNILQDQTRNRSPFDRRNARRNDYDRSYPLRASAASPARRRHSKSPYAAPRDEGNTHSPVHHRKFPDSPFLKSELRRHVSPYKIALEDHQLDNGKIASSNRKFRQACDDVSKVNDTSTYSGRRAVSVPKRTFKEKDLIKNESYWERSKPERTASPLRRNLSRKERDGSHKQAPSGGEINEMLANVKTAGAPTGMDPNFESTDSIVPGDIFFSRDYGAFTKQNSIFSTKNGTDVKFSEKPEFLIHTNPGFHKRNQANPWPNHNIREISATASNVSTQTTANSNFGVSRQSSNLSEFSGRTNGTIKNFLANRQKSQTDAWFSCIKRGSCRASEKSPEKPRGSYEALIIGRAFVVESLRQFWADKHRPSSLSEFTCHEQEALHLKQLATSEIPHILLKGPPGSGKKSLTLALLREIYGDTVRNISHDLHCFHIQETKPMEAIVPVSSSPHHVEFNVSSEPNVAYALMALVKKISTDYAVIREISNVNMKADYKVMVLYDVDKAADNIQHLIKWIMDCYSDACKLILCCEDEVNILEHVKSRCKVINVEAPVTHEIMEVLIQIAGKEEFELPMSFAARIANKSKQNMRGAIMALEACKAHNYPFSEDQPITLGWEEVLVELAAGILADPSPKRISFVRGKFQKLLADFVHPKLILLKLVEQFLKGVDASSKREIYYWHAYYDKRLTTGTSALLKLEEFTAKFMSIQRRSLNHHQVS
ncbi:uncharacterized protein [Coffea arabica]|uniref:Uncharacterized protein isoform X2 n=1 Tax=Coffea arabica TaxID=13443 RepID=A0ABM4V956_COFAR